MPYDPSQQPACSQISRRQQPRFRPGLGRPGAVRRGAGTDALPRHGHAWHAAPPRSERRAARPGVQDLPRPVAGDARAHEGGARGARGPGETRFGSAFDRERARAIADTEAKAIADMELLRAESMARVRQVLTPEQRAKLDQMRE